MAAKRRAKPVKRKTKRASGKRAVTSKRAAKPAKRTAKRTGAKRPTAPKRSAAPRRATSKPSGAPKRVTPKRSPDASTVVTAAHRAFDPEATQQLSFTEVLGDIEESMALGKLKEDA